MWQENKVGGAEAIARSWGTSSVGRGPLTYLKQESDTIQFIFLSVE